MALLGILQLLNSALGVATFALWLIVLIKLYNAQGVGQMLLGLFCTLYLFIWGWQNARHYGFTKVMNAWKLCVLGHLVVIVLFLATASQGY